MHKAQDKNKENISKHAEEHPEPGSLKRKDENRAFKRRMYLYFILCTALELLVALACASVLEFVFVRFGIISLDPLNTKWYWILIFSATSIIIGLALAMILGRMMFKPINTVTDGMVKLADGEYSTRIDLGKYEGMQKLSKTFNLLAQELENTEILRSSFVNDFSHELKTPIVSLVGLIGLMKNEKLSADKRSHYLDIMEAEANRLKQMTSSSLYLSKLETQSILTDKSVFNLSEQIRSSVLLLQRKWSQKGLELSLDFDEYTILANEDMLKQVWINLIDNAIKFAHDKSTLEISIEKIDGILRVSVTNEGIEIKDEERELIFHKFYQADKSRATEGNGIGLSIVKHIVTLHGGSIYVKSCGGRTTFTAELPAA